MTDEEWREDLGEVYEWEEVLDLTSLPEEEEVGHSLGEISNEEWALSSCRRVLQGRTDLLRAEFVRRGGGVALSPEELARVLLGEGSSPSTGEGDVS
jgi:hypothetical protein